MSSSSAISFPTENSAAIAALRSASPSEPAVPVSNSSVQLSLWPKELTKP